MDAGLDANGIIEQAVEREIARQGRSIRNKASLGALIKIIPCVGEALHHALIAGDAALNDEKVQLQLNLLCRLVEKIDSSITEMLEQSKLRDAGFVEVNGQITVHGTNVTNVTGLDIASGRSATIKPGTVVRVEAANATNATGVKI